jgi:hypothetical protein
MLRKLMRRLAALLGAPPRGLVLEQARAGEFFTFFQLERTCAPRPTLDGQFWHCFRPGGEKFRSLVELAVLTDSADRVVSARLGLDRAFVDHATDGVFARDIAKSYLSWSIPRPIPSAAALLIENIGDFPAAGTPMIMRSPQPRPRGSDSTGGYDVYLGRRRRVDIALERARITFANIDGRLPASEIFSADAGANVNATRPAANSSWLAIDVVT